MTSKLFFFSLLIVFILANKQDDDSSKQSIKQLQANIDKLNSKIEQLSTNSKQVTTLQTTLNKLENDIKTIKNDLNQCQSSLKQFNSLQNELNNIKSLSNSQTNQIKDLETQIISNNNNEGLEKSIKDNLNKIESQSAQIKELETKLTQVTSTDTSNIDLTEIESKITKNEEIIRGALKVQNSSTKKKLEAFTTEINSIKEDMIVIRESVSKNVRNSKFEENLREIRSRISKLKKNITGMNEIVNELKNNDNKVDSGDISARVAKLEKLTFEYRLNQFEMYLKYGIGEAMDLSVQGYKQMEIYYKKYKINDYITKTKKMYNDAYKKLVNEETRAKLNKYKKDMNKLKKEKIKDIKRYYKNLSPIIKKKYKSFSDDLGYKLNNLRIELAKKQWYQDFRKLISPFLKEAGIDQKYEHIIVRTLLILISFLSIIILVKLFFVMVNCCCPVIESDNDSTPDIAED